MLGEWFSATALVLVLDQASKTFVLVWLQKRPRFLIEHRSWIRRVDNAGVAVGLIRDRRALFLLWCVAVVGTSLVIWHAAPFQGHAAHVGLGAAIGGATGNLLDVLRRGAVVDFIDLRILPVFNIADAAIVLGVVVALWSAGWSAQ
jgi:signal peptidase II